MYSAALFSLSILPLLMWPLAAPNWKDGASLSQRSVRQTLEDVSTWTRPLHHERARLPFSSIRWRRLLSDRAVCSRVLPSTASHSVPLLHTCTGSRPQLSAHSPLSHRASRASELHLDGDVRAGVSPIEDGSQVELGVSRLLEDTWSHSVALTADYSVNIWSCGTKTHRDGTKSWFV